MNSSKLLFFILISSVLSCENHVPNSEAESTAEDHAIKNFTAQNDNIHKTKKVYVPVYSNIYQSTRNDRTSLTSTLSIHNTSETDTLFITRIDYHNTEGKLVKKYLDHPIYLNTFETIEYVVDEKDESGGSGANFVIEWYGDKKLNPLFQAVMIGGLGSKSFSFTTEGVLFE
ncbi:MAG TPA: DUF3124 domain-containing protein [Brumimicrobium sp.]|nr:DUF3124 domain-containing protein [Brumimicrobium sp.]